MPVASGGVDHFGGGGFGVLDGFAATEEVIEDVGNHEQGFGGIEFWIAGQDHGIDLEEGVVGKGLRARGGIEIGFGDALEEASRDAYGAWVAIVGGIVEQAAATVKEGEVNAPGVDGDACGRVGKTRAEFDEAGLNLRPDAQRVPVEAAVETHAGVREAM